MPIFTAHCSDQHGLVTAWNRDKGCVVKNFNVHDDAINCLALLRDSDDVVRGFAAAGVSSMICLYRDVSDRQLTIMKESREAALQEQQELDNLLFRNDYSRALRLAIKLDKPLAAYKILSKIQEAETDTVTELSPLEMSTKTEVGKTVVALEQDELRKLFLFAVKWNTNIKTFLIGQRIVAIVVCSVSKSELMLWPDFARHLEALHAYSSRERRSYG